MTAFDVRMGENGVAAVYDRRYAERVDITDGTGRFGWLAYTQKTDDITTADKPEFVPYTTRYAGFTAGTVADGGWRLENPAFDLTLTVRSLPDRLVLEQTGDGDTLSACGLFLPLNFLSDKNGVPERQFLISSPYHTADKRHWLHYFTRPDGRDLVAVAEQPIAGYRICYSPFLCGHFIRGMEFLRSFDRAYGQTPPGGDRLTVHLFPVSSYREALEKAGEVWGIPALYYDTAAVRCGEEFTLQPIGEVGAVCITAPSGKQTVTDTLCFTPSEYGIHTAVPVGGGMDCAFFAYDGLAAIHRRACGALPDDRSEHLGTAPDGTPIWRPTHLFYRQYHDHNLCEHGMWCWSLLRYMRTAGVQQPYDSMVRNHLRVVMGEGAELDSCTLLGSQDYRTKNSTRIQEAYAGVNLLLDAWRLYGERRYLDFAATVLEKRLACDMGADGGLYRHGSDGATAEVVDYTTVTCLVFPVVDLALELEKCGDPRAGRFRRAAERIADHLVARGLSFPTEGGQHPEVNAELEEGSIACTALSVLYVAAHITYKSAYVAFAGEILRRHDAYTVYTPHPVMFRSSLRWWETIWEGDADGPAVCFGHAWSLWRAEAQYWYGLLAHDDARLFDSYNGFMGNYAKVQADGTTYAIYQYEPLSGTAVATNGREVTYAPHDGFPQHPDVTTAHYLFARDLECWRQTLAIVNVGGERILGGARRGEVIVPDAPVGTLVLGDVHGRFLIETAGIPPITSTHSYTVQRTAQYLIVTVE